MCMKLGSAISLGYIFRVTPGSASVCVRILSVLFSAESAFRSRLLSDSAEPYHSDPRYKHHGTKRDFSTDILSDFRIKGELGAVDPGSVFDEDP